MEPTYSESMFVLKVNKDCQACRVRMGVALGSICGVYDIEYDGYEGVLKVRGVVDPNMLMKAFAGSGPHAECIAFRIRHPGLNTSYSYNDDNDPYYHRNGYTYGHLNGSFSPARALSFNVGPISSYPYSMSAPYHPQSYPYYRGLDLPPAQYVPSYPPQEYDPYAEEHYNFCSIM